MGKWIRTTKIVFATLYKKGGPENGSPFFVCALLSIRGCFTTSHKEIPRFASEWISLYSFGSFASPYIALHLISPANLSVHIYKHSEHVRQNVRSYCIIYQNNLVYYLNRGCWISPKDLNLNNRRCNRWSLGNSRSEPSKGFNSAEIEPFRGFWIWFPL